MIRCKVLVALLLASDVEPAHRLQEGVEITHVFMVVKINIHLPCWHGRLIDWLPLLLDGAWMPAPEQALTGAEREVLGPRSAVPASVIASDVSFRYTFRKVVSSLRRSDAKDQLPGRLGHDMPIPHGPDAGLSRKSISTCSVFLTRCGASWKMVRVNVEAPMI